MQKNALKLLLTKDQKEAKEIAGELNKLNIERQEMCNRILDEAKAQIEASKKEKSILLLSDKSWPRGVVGIIASRISESYARPAIVFEYDGVEHHGSARSIEGFDITAALGACDNHLLKYGGHAKAAGLTVSEEQFALFEEALQKIAQNQIKKEDLRPILKIVSKMETADLTEETADKIAELEPFGYGNPLPVFAVKASVTNQKKVGQEKNHLKFNVGNIGAVWFSFTKDLEEGKEYEIAFRLGYNVWNNRKSLEIRVLDVREAK